MAISISKEKFQEIKRKYNTLLIVDGEAAEALEFVYDLLCAEADAIKAAEPYATNTIKRLETAAYEVFELSQGIEEVNG